MLTLRSNNGLLDIIHRSGPSGRLIACSFGSDFLPATAIRHLHALGIFRQQEVVFMLSPTDDAAVSEVLHKLESEKDSGYVFSEQLRKTYLIELIHLITKFHSRRTV